MNPNKSKTVLETKVSKTQSKQVSTNSNTYYKLELNSVINNRDNSKNKIETKAKPISNKIPQSRNSSVSPVKIDKKQSKSKLSFYSRTFE